MSARYKFIKEPDLDNPVFDPNIRVEMSFEANDIETILEVLADFLRASAFSVGTIEHVHSANVASCKNE